MKKKNKDLNNNPIMTSKNAPIKRKRHRKTFFQKRYKEIIILGSILVFFLFSILHSENTIILNAEKDITTETADSYIFTNSEYVDLNETTPIKYTVKEGQKVGANTIL